MKKEWKIIAGLVIALAVSCIMCLGVFYFVSFDPGDKQKAEVSACLELPRFSGHMGACGMRGTSMQGFVPIGGKIVNGGVSPMGSVPAFDELKDSLACFYRH